MGRRVSQAQLLVSVRLLSGSTDGRLFRARGAFETAGGTSVKRRWVKPSSLVNDLRRVRERLALLIAHLVVGQGVLAHAYACRIAEPCCGWWRGGEGRGRVLVQDGVRWWLREAAPRHTSSNSHGVADELLLLLLLVLAVVAVGAPPPSPSLLSTVVGEEELHRRPMVESSAPLLLCCCWRRRAAAAPT